VERDLRIFPLHPASRCQGGKRGAGDAQTGSGAIQRSMVGIIRPELSDMFRRLKHRRHEGGGEEKIMNERIAEDVTG